MVCMLQISCCLCFAVFGLRVNSVDYVVLLHTCGFCDGLVIGCFVCLCFGWLSLLCSCFASDVACLFWWVAEFWLF